MYRLHLLFSLSLDLQTSQFVSEYLISIFTYYLGNAKPKSRGKSLFFVKVLTIFLRAFAFVNLLLHKDTQPHGQRRKIQGKGR